MRRKDAGLFVCAFFLLIYWRNLVKKEEIERIKGGHSLSLVGALVVGMADAALTTKLRPSVKTNVKINFSAPSWSFRTAMLATVFANERAMDPDFGKTFDDHVVQFFSGGKERLRKELCAHFETAHRQIKMLDRNFDVRSEKLPAIVWLRLAFRLWLVVGGSSSKCLASYTEWRSVASRRNQLILVAPESVALKIKHGEISGAEIGACPDCYSLDMFLIAETLHPPGLREPWRVVRVRLENYSDQTKPVVPTNQGRSFQASVGVGRYEQAKAAIQAAAKDRALGRKLSTLVDKKTNKYLYEGRREDLLEALKASKYPITAGKDVALKLISHFVQCRKGSVRSRHSEAGALGRKFPLKRPKAQL